MKDNLRDNLLAEFGVTIDQYWILSLLREYCRSRGELIVDAYEESRGDPSSSRHAEAFLAAVAECAQKQWIYTLTFPQKEIQDARLRSESIPSCVELYARAGEVELTDSGYFVIEHIIRSRSDLKRAGVRWIDQVDRQIAEVYAEDEKSCRARFDFQFDGPEKWVERYDDGLVRSYERGAVCGPESVGSWRYSRHEVVPSGFKMSTVLRWLEERTGA